MKMIAAVGRNYEIGIANERTAPALFYRSEAI